MADTPQGTPGVTPLTAGTPKPKTIFDVFGGFQKVEVRYIREADRKQFYVGRFGKEMFEANPDFLAVQYGGGSYNVQAVGTGNEYGASMEIAYDEAIFGPHHGPATAKMAAAPPTNGATPPPAAADPMDAMAKIITVLGPLLRPVQTTPPLGVADVIALADKMGSRDTGFDSAKLFEIYMTGFKAGQLGSTPPTDWAGVIGGNVNKAIDLLGNKIIPWMGYNAALKSGAAHLGGNGKGNGVRRAAAPAAPANGGAPADPEPPLEGEVQTDENEPGEEPDYMLIGFIQRIEVMADEHMLPKVAAENIIRMIPEMAWPTFYGILTTTDLAAMVKGYRPGLTRHDAWLNNVVAELKPLAETRNAKVTAAGPA